MSKKNETLQIETNKDSVVITIPKSLSKKIGIKNQKDKLFAVVTDNVLQISAFQPRAVIPMFVENESLFLPH